MNDAPRPPANVEAEAALIGALMIENELIDAAADRVKSADFFEPLYGQIFDAIVGKRSLGQIANPVTLKPIFEGHEGLKALGGVGHLAMLTSSGAGLIGAKDFATQIAELAHRRRVLESLQEAIAAAQDTSTPMASLAVAVENAVELSADDSGIVEVNLMQASDMLFDEHHRGGGIKCGNIPTLDKLWTGLKPKQLVIVAARPGMGKTALSLSYSLGVAESGTGVLFVSLEMGAAEIAGRVLADRMTRSNAIEYSKIANGWLSQEEKQRLIRLSGELESLPLQIIDQSNLRPARLSALVRRWKRRFKARGIDLGLVVVDYLGLMSPDRDQGSRYENVTSISKALKHIAKEHDIPVIALAQLSREVEKRENKRPTLADLRDSGSIEQDADRVLFLLRDEYYLDQIKPDENDAGKMLIWEQSMEKAQGQIELILAKNRGGRVGSAKAEFIGEYQVVRG
jgi:replicative DNA helicase